MRLRVNSSILGETRRRETARAPLREPHNHHCKSRSAQSSLQIRISALDSTEQGYVQI